MEDSTSILNLPNKAAIGGGMNPPPSAGAGAAMTQPPSASTDIIDPQYMNQIINGIQQSGGTTLGQLPSRNIPMNTAEIQQDPATRANYIPPAPPMRDYINEYEERRRVASEYVDGYGKPTRPKENTPAKSIYDDLYLPILIAILFFLFHMPSVNVAFYKYARFLHNEDGNISIMGIFLKSIIFGVGVYGINRAMSFI